mmetsp:Transcript_18992/g.45827  ORF Transcript_18992/g.45827 Transcript_18992/m.45827 type:complete len:307 (+) Transcript_18992:718-1638(+)
MPLVTDDHVGAGVDERFRVPLPQVDLVLGFAREAPPSRQVAVSLVPDEHDAALSLPLLEVRQTLLVQLASVRVGHAPHGGRLFIAPARHPLLELRPPVAESVDRRDHQRAEVVLLLLLRARPSGVDCCDRLEGLAEAHAVREDRAGAFDHRVVPHESHSNALVRLELPGDAEGKLVVRLCLTILALLPREHHGLAELGFGSVSELVSQLLGRLALLGRLEVGGAESHGLELLLLGSGRRSRLVLPTVRPRLAVRDQLDAPALLLLLLRLGVELVGRLLLPPLVAPLSRRSEAVHSIVTRVDLPSRG